MGRTRKARTEESEAITRRGVGHQMRQLAQLQVPKTNATKRSGDRRRNRNGWTDDVLTGRLEVARQSRVVLEHHDILRAVAVRACASVSRCSRNKKNNNNETIKK